MSYCSQCGSKVSENAKFCENCGSEVNLLKRGIQKNPQAQQEPVCVRKQEALPGTNSTPVKENAVSFNPPSDFTEEFYQEDIEQNKLMGVLSYLSFLVLIPLFADKGSKFARFHANQGLVLCLAEVAFVVVYMILSAILVGISFNLLFLATLLGLLGLVFPVLAIMGIINVANGKAKELPVIGKVRLLK